MIGRTVSHYRILEEVGAGGMGVVYKAEDTKLKRIVALKFLPGGQSGDEAARKRFLHEAQAISALQHHNICTIHEIDETEDGRTFICMDYYEGETLKARLSRGPMSVDEAIDITVQVASGLAEAHHRGIVHRDIKPANVVLTTQGVAKILDFGLAKLTAQSKVTRTGTTLGTVAYMSPEQVRGEELDARSDIFSLGVMFYELLTGATPFAAEYEQATMHKILNVAPPPVRNSGVKNAAVLEPVLGRMLAKDRDERMASAREVSDALSRVRSADGRAKASPRRRPPRSAVVGLAAAALAVLVALVLVRPWQKASDRTTEGRMAIAVLPFQNLSANESHAYFAGGLHDEILTQLSKVSVLRVISRTSVMGYADGKTPLPQIGRELGVGSIVEGSVQVVGDRLRVNVQLIDAETDEHLWAERYDRTLEDAFAIQSDVAHRIVEAVGAKLGSTEAEMIAQAPTSNPDAYQIYLQARTYAIRPGSLRKDFESAVRLCERALALDPNFALAHAELSRAHGRMYWFGYDSSPARAARQREEAEAALRLAPELPQAHVAMGLVYYWGSRDYARALEEFDIALQGLPNDARLWFLVGAIHRRLGNWDKVYEVYDRITRLDPRDAHLFLDMGGYTFRLTRRYEEAIQACDAALAISPDLYVAAAEKAWIYFQWRGALDSVRVALDRMPPDASLGPRGTVRSHRAQQLLFERRPVDVLALMAASPVEAFICQDYYSPVPLYEAWAHQLAGDPVSARAAFESALAVLDSAIVGLSGDDRVHVARGLTLAGLGRRVEALEEAEWIVQSVRYRGDSLDHGFAAMERAQILAQVGAADAAFGEIESILSRPAWYSVYFLELDPLMDPLRATHASKR